MEKNSWVIKSWICALAFCSSCLAAGERVANSAIAGVVVSSEARVKYLVQGNASTEVSRVASASFTVATTVGAKVAAINSQAIKVLSPASIQVVPFVLLNTGNDVDSYSLRISEESSGLVSPRIFIESNDVEGLQNHGESGIDEPYSELEGITLGPWTSKIVYVTGLLPPKLNPGEVFSLTLVAKSRKLGSAAGMAGETISLATGGEGVLLVDRGKDRASVSLIIPEDKITVKKTIQQIRDTNGGTLLNPGAEVTYKIKINVLGKLKTLYVTDKTPNNMRYKRGSLVLNGKALTDEEDGDGASFSSEKESVIFDLNEAEPGNTLELLVTYIIE